jgi:hypothetical protein
MSSNTKTIEVGGSGISFMGALFLVFLVLKLCDVIDWSWWWVTAPLWGSIVLGIIITILFAIAAIIVLGIIFMVVLYKEYKGIR